MTDEVGRGTVLAGRYRVLEPLPSDLEGVAVWRATDQILDRPVRVRVLRSGAVAPALDAARRAALVTDARLVRILDVGTHEGVGYVVSEQVNGVSLAQLVERGPLGPDQARAVVGEAAAALEVARRRGVHHLALRPSVVHVAADGRVLVSGLAIDAALLGREQQDARATSRADAVDLVRLLYTALTGRWPVGPDVVPVRDVPPAPVLDGVAVAPGELVAGVPNDLDTLCAVTLGPHEDGPHSPGELVHELEPWGEIRIGRVEEDVRAGAGGAVAAAAAAVASGPERPEAPVRVARQSVRSAFDELQQPAATRPGTPPPAAPARTSTMQSGRVDRTSALPPTAVGAAGYGESHPPSVPASLPPLAGQGGPTAAEPNVPWGGGFADDPFSFGVEEEDDGPQRRKFDPTVVVLVVVGIAVLVGLVVAMRALFGPQGGQEAGSGSTPEPAPTVVEESAAAPAPEATQEEAPVGAPPVIASVRTLDPTSPEGERVENVERSFDGDPASFWHSFTYNRPDFAGLKDAVGLEVTLAEETTVSGVTLSVNGTGGSVEVRATTGDAPTTGDVLAQSTMSQETVLAFAQPVQTSTLVLWFTELPTNAEGKFRIEVNEITVS